MKYIKVTHIKIGNEEFYVISNILLIHKYDDCIQFFTNDDSSSAIYDTKKYDIQEVNTLF